jgi:hypothetical protein
MSYDRPTLVFPGMKHAYLLGLQFLGLNPPQFKRAEIMPGKTKVGRSYIDLAQSTMFKFKNLI